MKKNKVQETKALTDAQQAMITEELIGYADAMTNRYRYCGVEMDDLMQEARYGLCQAVVHFDPEAGVSLKTFATYYIKKYILQAIKDYGTSMGIPREDRQQLVILSLNIELTRGESKIRSDGEAESLDNMEQGLLEEFISEDDRLDKEETSEYVENLLSVLTAKELKVVECMFGLKDTALTVKETAKVLHVKPERVRQLHEKAMNKLQMSI